MAPPRGRFRRHFADRPRDMATTPTSPDAKPDVWCKQCRDKCRFGLRISDEVLLWTMADTSSKPVFGRISFRPVAAARHLKDCPAQPSMLRQEARAFWEESNAQRRHMTRTHRKTSKALTTSKTSKKISPMATQVQDVGRLVGRRGREGTNYLGTTASPTPYPTAASVDPAPSTALNVSLNQLPLHSSHFLASTLSLGSQVRDPADSVCYAGTQLAARTCQTNEAFPETAHHCAATQATVGAVVPNGWRQASSTLQQGMPPMGGGYHGYPWAAHAYASATPDAVKDLPFGNIPEPSHFAPSRLPADATSSTSHGISTVRSAAAPMQVRPWHHRGSYTAEADDTVS